MNYEVKDEQQYQQSANKFSAGKQKQSQQQQQESSDDDDNEEESCAMPTATTTTTERKNLEFAQKLGYNSQSIHTALTRLGSEAKQNELLAELIKLTADAPRPTIASNVSSNNNNNNGHNQSPGSSSVGTLRHIVIDGSNVALAHGNNALFSCRGIRICIDYFRQRGHRQITAFVPNWRKESARTNLANSNITEQELLYDLERERVLVFTPSRHLEGGKRVACYDDRYILKLAAETDGIVVSNDNYRDLLLESNEFRRVVQERLLMYSFVNDRFMPPDDPLGRAGPTLDMLLRSQTQQKMVDAQQLCPYGKKCTYGQKCKFRHQPSLLQRMPLQASHSAPLHSNGQLNGAGVHSGNNNNNSSNNVKLTPLASREPLGRTKSNTIEKISQQQQLQLCQQFNSQLELDADPQLHLNRHKKLQRQQAPAAYPLLVPTYSAPLMPQRTLAASPSGSYHHHQHLTRTPSAPATDGGGQVLSLPAHNFAHLSASDSRINEELHTAQTREEKRRLLRYHLSSLFPQHQVHAVLLMYPEETDAKAICAAILNLFPHN